MSTKFVVSHLEQQLGPFDEAEIKAKWEAGELLPIDYVYVEAKQDWILLQEQFPWAAKKSAPPVMESSAPPPITERKAPPARRMTETAIFAAPLAPATPAAPTPAAKNVSGITLSEPLNLSPVAPTPVAPAAALPNFPAMPAAAMVASIPLAAQTPAQQLPPQNAPNPQMTQVAPPPAVAAPQVQPAIKGASVTKEWKKPNAQGAKVKLIDGVGEVDLSPLNPGKVELVLQDSTASMLKLQNPLKIDVKAAEPVEVVWAFPNSQVCGQEIELTMQALDENGHVCEHYDDQFLLKITNGEAKNTVVNLEAGQAALKFQHTKAESWKIELQYVGTRRLKLPEMRTFEWQPGPATRLVLDGPQEHMAGHPLKVNVKAVDAYGNLAKTFQGTVILEVKAS